MLRSDLADLFPGEPRAAAVAGATRTLAELLTAPPPLGPGPDWAPPDLAGSRSSPSRTATTTRSWATTRTGRCWPAGRHGHTLAGCCGLAGNFGMERGHYEVSVAVAETALLPALRAAPPGAVYLADGFSCRTQADQLGGVRGEHLAQLLAARLRP